jgi:hypothetical protein
MEYCPYSVKHTLCATMSIKEQNRNPGKEKEVMILINIIKVPLINVHQEKNSLKTDAISKINANKIVALIWSMICVSSFFYVFTDCGRGFIFTFPPAFF